jgi:tRNA G18 (ribose-2'-O)-methylase SpoU
MDEHNPQLRVIKYNVHTILQDKPKERLKEISSKLSLPVHLMLFNLDGNMNIAMSIRSAAVLGCSDVWIIGRRKYDARPEVGSHNYIRVHKLESIDPHVFFKEHQLEPIILEQGGEPLEDFKFKAYFEKSVCFIVGSESHGFPSDFLKALKTTSRITISQYGIVRSFNVSMAASIVLYEYLKQLRNFKKNI